MTCYQDTPAAHTLTDAAAGGNITLGAGGVGLPAKGFLLPESCAEVAELADALHSGCSARQGVEVRVLSSAPILFLPLYLR